MKKSISAILVAALMLFAFTACEQPAMEIPTENGKEIANISVTSANVYAGTEETSVPAVVTVTYRDGSTTPNVAVELTLASETVAGSNFGTVSYSGLSGNNAKWTVEYQGIAVSNITLDVAEEDLKVSYTDLASPCAITGDVTITYADGHIETEKDATLSWNSTEQSKITAVQASVPAKYTSGKTDLVASADLAITGGPTAPAITGLVVEYQYPDAFDATGAKHFYGEKYTYNVYAATGSTGSYVKTGEPLVLNRDYYIEDGKTFSGVFGAGETLTLVYAKNPTIKLPVTIAAGDDYISNVAGSGTIKGTATISKNTKLSADDIQIVATYAKPATGTDPVYVPSANLTVLDANPDAGKTGSVRVLVKYGKGESLATTVTLSVTVPAEQGQQG